MQPPHMMPHHIIPYLCTYNSHNYITNHTSWSFDLISHNLPCINSSCQSIMNTANKEPSQFITTQVSTQSNHKLAIMGDIYLQIKISKLKSYCSTQNFNLIQWLTNWESQFYENCWDKKKSVALNAMNLIPRLTTLDCNIKM